MRSILKSLPSASLALATGAALSLAACAGKEPPPAPVAAPDAASAAVPEATPPPAPGAAPAAVDRAWTAEALEELLAPIALYPDPVLSQVLIASTNPQEVLDAGNWLVVNASLEGKALDDAAAGVGFTPPVRALVQFPETVDMMCLQMAWTTELGQAFTADQAGVLDAVQRLRAQAAAAAATTAVPVASAPTTVTTEKEGHSTGSLIATGVLAFGAGILVNELFDDDDDYRRYGYDYPNYGYGGMPYYPPYPDRPVYGGGFYPGNSYMRPPGYNSGFQNNGTIIINNNRPGGGYWDRWGANSRPGSPGYRPRTVSSPITAARGNRPELRELNQRTPRARPADLKPPAPSLTAANWRGQSSYAGANRAGRPANKAAIPADPRERIAAATPGYSKPATARPAAKAPAAKAAGAKGPAGKGPAVKAPPKVQGSYAGARPASMPQRPSVAGRPASSFGHSPAMSRNAAVSSVQRGGAAERAASARGRQSLPQGGGAARRQGR